MNIKISSSFSYLQKLNRSEESCPDFLFSCLVIRALAPHYAKAGRKRKEKEVLIIVILESKPKPAAAKAKKPAAKAAAPASTGDPLADKLRDQKLVEESDYQNVQDIHEE